jgi:flagella basal body P-ring formation protein FlgA
MPPPSPLDIPVEKCDAVQSARPVRAWASDQCGKRLPHTGNAQPRTQCSSKPNRGIGSERASPGVKESTPRADGTQIAFNIAMYTLRTILYASLFTAVSAAAAMDIEDPALIRAAAENAVRAEAGAAASALTLQVAPLDSRLRVASCDRRLTAFMSGNSALRSQTTVGVRCEGTIRWTIYTSVNVQSQAKVLLARRSLTRDAEVTAADFRIEDRLVPGLSSAYVSDPATLAGQRLGHPMAAGDPLTLETLAPANLIHRGQQVTLLAHAGGFEVRMVGVALSDGHESERIKVQNQSSQRVVEGIVRSSNEVEIPL